MKFSGARAGIIARREYVTTVTRKAFILTLLGTPAFYALLMFIMIKPQADDALKSMRSFKSLGVVDSSGLLGEAPRAITTTISSDDNPFQRKNAMVPARVESLQTRVVFFADQEAGLAALRKEEVGQLVVVPAGYLESGRLRRYVEAENLFNDAAERPVQRWVTRALLAGHADSARLDRALAVSRAMDLYKPKTPGGPFQLKDDAAAVFDFMVPFVMGLLLSITIVIGGQYLLQGVSEEKESRILESMMCAVTAEELVVGKLVGLGSVGLTMVGSWIAMGAAISGPMLMAVKVPVSTPLLVFMVVYFALGYFFYASVMTGVGAVTNNLREANQTAFVFTFMNFIPFYMMTTIIGHPNGAIAVGLSLFPPTAPTSMMLRLAAPDAVVPPWQIALSLALMVAAGAIALKVAAKVFRIGLLLYGKTPNLPEIMRWVRQS